MQRLTTTQRTTIREYLLAAGATLPMLVICFAVLNTHQIHAGTVRSVPLDRDGWQAWDAWMDWFVWLGWCAVSASFVLIPAFAAYEFFGRSQRKALVRRLVLVSGSVAVSTYTVASATLLIVLLAVDTRILTNMHNM